jgi:hypothetical protein
MDLELMSKKQAVMELHGIEDEEKAQDLLDEIKKDNEFNAPELPELPNMIEVDEDDEEES